MTTTATGQPAAEAAGEQPGLSRWRPRGLAPRLAGAAVSGAMVALALPPYDLWPLAPLGLALLVLLSRGLSARRAAAVGLVQGLATFVPLLSWLTVIGPDAWLLVALLEASFLALAGALTPSVLRLPGWPLWVACLWVAEELARDTVPFGGFPWGRLAFAETASPFTPYAAVAGAPLVTFATALCGALVAAAVVAAGSWRRAVPLALLAVAVPVVGLLLPVGAGEGRPVTVALVQGDVPGVGLDQFGEREQVLRNHVDATHRLAADVRAGRVDRPDLVVWPENASDIDPFQDPSAQALIDDAVRDVGVPVLVGAVLDGPGPDHVSNTGIVWDPRTGPGARYVKRHPVPFGEYIPFRAELTGLISRLDQIPRDFYAGHRPGNLTVGPARVGDVICFEVAYDGLVRDVVRGGAQVLVVQTNNATYNGTGQPYQQMAMSRLRAVETGRDVLVTATSGISAVVRADGTVAQEAPEKVARTLVAEVPLRDSQTLATRLGWWPEWLLAAAGLAAAALSSGLSVAAARRRRGSRP
ncbi:MAG TPA: apolipoprotein N-acyltransferase [Mycobacteriales bacterium]|nr:apolipoprotein N-acyltransferase [Mycobacteriales bacterium]